MLFGKIQVGLESSQCVCVCVCVSVCVCVWGGGGGGGNPCNVTPRSAPDDELLKNLLLESLVYICVRISSLSSPINLPTISRVIVAREIDRRDLLR